MSERTSYSAGTPCWVDLGTPDIDAAAAFYGGLFGWRVEEGETSEETGGYRQAELGGKPVAGLMPLMQEGQPPAWSTYVAVADADATAAAVREAGGVVLAEPMDVLDLGRMAVFADPEGAVFGIWQAGSFVGAQVVKEGGAVVWTQINSRDLGRSREFYGRVFGWDFDERRFQTGPYTQIQVAGEVVGGMTDFGAQASAEEPAHWLVYFATDDVDATVQSARDAGGGVRLEPHDIPEVGRIAVLADPFGAVFAVIAPNPAM